MTQLNLIISTDIHKAPSPITSTTPPRSSIRQPSRRGQLPLAPQPGSKRARKSTQLPHLLTFQNRRTCQPSQLSPGTKMPEQQGRLTTFSSVQISAEPGGQTAASLLKQHVRSKQLGTWEGAFLSPCELRPLPAPGHSGGPMRCLA